MKSVIPERIARAGALAAMSTRLDGASDAPYGMNLSFMVGDNEQAVQANRRLFFGSLGIGLDELAIPRQVHGTLIRRADQPGSYPDCDGLVSDRKRVFLCISVADCVPVLVFEPHRRVAGAFHAGWRGTAGRIVALGVQRLVQEFGADPAAMFAFVGPAAGGCCYEVGEEVADKLPPRFVDRSAGRPKVDLKGANAAQLEESGLLPANIEVHAGCTIMDPSLFHSYRRDGPRSGRMMAVIGIP